MKTILTLTLMLTLFAPFRIGVKATGSNKKPEGAAIRYEYKYSSTMMYPLTWYCAERDSTGVVKISFSRDAEREISIIQAPDDFFERVGALAAEYKLHRLRGTYTPRALVFDGYMWSVYIRYEKGSISSGGSNAWPPKNLDAGINAINQYIEKLIQTAGEAGVIGHDDHDSLYNRRFGR